MEYVSLALVIVLVLVAVWVASGLQSVVVYEHQRAIAYRNGRIQTVLEPGRHWIFRRTTRLTTLDMRQSSWMLPGQEVVTIDGIGVKVSIVARYRVTDPIATVRDVENYITASYAALQVALRNVTARLTIDELLGQRAGLGTEITAEAAPVLHEFGLELLGVDVRDLMLPGPLKRIYSQAVEARQQGLASLEKVRTETAALRNLVNAARLVDAQPSLLQLRVLEKLDGGGNTIVLGMPDLAMASAVRPRRIASAPAAEPSETPD